MVSPGSTTSRARSSVRNALSGERPSHMNLLDWLADDVVRHGWDQKRLHRMMLLSRTYQQLSRRSTELDEIDEATPDTPSGDKLKYVLKWMNKSHLDNKEKIYNILLNLQKNYIISISFTSQLHLFYLCCD